jgi:hypothetical protein
MAEQMTSVRTQLNDLATHTQTSPPGRP